MTTTTNGLHPVQHRGYRELQAATRQMRDHWRQLAAWLPPDQGADVMQAGASAATALTSDLELELERYGVSTRPASESLGATIGLLRRGVADRFLERHQALRAATLDAQHVALLLDFLARAAGARGDTLAKAFCERRHEEFEGVARQASATAAALGSRPDEAILPVDASAAGRVAHKVAENAGAAGEWIDRRISGRAPT